MDTPAYQPNILLIPKLSHYESILSHFIPTVKKSSKFGAKITHYPAFQQLLTNQYPPYHIHILRSSSIHGVLTASAISAPGRSTSHFLCPLDTRAVSPSQALTRLAAVPRESRSSESKIKGHLQYPLPGDVMGCIATREPQ